MQIVLSQIRLTLNDIDKLLKEFPQYLFLSFTEFTYKELGREEWKQVEIIYGSRITPEELAIAPQLHWVHTPTPNLNKLCLKEMQDRGNILISTTTEENIIQIGEFAMAGVLAFAKNLIHWHQAKHSPHHFWVSRWRDNMWSLQDKIFLQIGLGSTGTEITRRARQMGMKVWGMGIQPKPSFHPYCHQTLGMQDLHAALDQADIVSLSLPKTSKYDNWFGIKELERLKEDSVLLILGSHKVVDEDDLAANSQKLRGILLDASYQTPIPSNSRLWEIPNILITPDVAPRPRSKEEQSFGTFRYNLRQYSHGNFQDMRNLVENIISH